MPWVKQMEINAPSSVTIRNHKINFAGGRLKTNKY